MGESFSLSFPLFCVINLIEISACDSYGESIRLNYCNEFPGNGGDADDKPPVPDIVLDHNLSERFECRFSAVRIERTPSIMLRGMEGSILGVWIAHGEGIPETWNR